MLMGCVEIRTLESLRKIGSVEPDKMLFLPNTRLSAVTENLNMPHRACLPERVNALMTSAEPTRVTLLRVNTSALLRLRPQPLFL